LLLICHRLFFVGVLHHGAESFSLHARAARDRPDFWELSVMNRSVLRAATLLTLCLAANAAFAAFIPYHDGFNGGLTFTTSRLNTAPPGWISNNGTVDWVKNLDFGIHCFGGSKGCVDLDGTSGTAGLLQNATPFSLLAGHTYKLSAEISGNQRGGNPDSFEFGFLHGSTLAGVLKSATVTGITSGSLYTLYTLFFTPSSNISAKAFFYDTTGGDNIGPILDEVRVTSVPLPAAAWLMLSGLAALGAVARRRINGGATA
jgi:hypothetical protein